jgi:hypothetical protein
MSSDPREAIALLRYRIVADGYPLGLVVGNRESLYNVRQTRLGPGISGLHASQHRRFGCCQPLLITREKGLSRDSGEAAAFITSTRRGYGLVRPRL